MVTKRLVFGAEGVADGYTFADSARTAELKIVPDEISPDLGPDEDAARDVELEASTDVDQQVFAAHVVGTASERAVHVRSVEADAFTTEAPQHFGRSAFTETRRPNGVEIVEDGTIGLETEADILVGTPGDFAFDTELMLKQEIAAEYGISSAAHHLGRIASGRGRSVGAGEPADPEPEIDLLRTRRTDQKKSRQHH